MPRLYRPHIPLDVRCRVALRQLGEMFIDDVIAANTGRYRAFLDELLQALAELLRPGEAIKLQLDHDPPLGAREKTGEGADTVYTPDANDPEFLIYREKEAHGIKTRVRGEHGQYSDLALIKRKRSRERPKKKRPGFTFGVNKSTKKMKRPKTRWASRPFPKRKK